MEIKIYSRKEMLAKSIEVGYLRINIFHDWPYLYEGNIQEAKNYLDDYAKSEYGRLITLEDEGKIVGMITGVPLNEYDSSMQEKIQGKNYYIGDFILLAEYRGKKQGQALYDFAINHFNTLPFDNLVLAMIKREDNHPRKPKDARDLRSFTQKQGFSLIPGIGIEYMWQELGDLTPTRHMLECFIKKI